MITPAIVVGLMSGCVLGRFGTLVARTTFTPTAKVVDVFALGALLRPVGSDAGIGIAWRRTAYVYPREKGDVAVMGAHWSYGRAPLDREAPFFLIARGIGAEMAFFPGFTRVHVGYAEDSFTFASGLAADSSVSFQYRPSAPDATCLTISTAIK